MEEILFTREFDSFIESNKELINNNYYISNFNLCKCLKIDRTTFPKIGLKDKLNIQDRKYLILLDDESLSILKELFYIKKGFYLNPTESISYIEEECGINSFNYKTFETLFLLLEISPIKSSFTFKNNTIFFTKELVDPIISFIKDFIKQNNNEYSGVKFQQYWSKYTEEKYFNLFEEKYSIKFWRNFLKEFTGDKNCYKHLCKYLEIPILNFDFQKEIPDIKIGRKISCEYISQNDYIKLTTYLNTHTTAERVKEQREKTNLERFGAINNSCTHEWKDQVRSKSLRDWGTDWPTQSVKFKEKVVKSNIEKYGVESPNSLPDKIAKQVATLNKRYSNPDSEYAKRRLEKVINTSRERYGTDNPNQSQIVKNKNKETRRKRIEEDKKKIQEELNINEELFTIAEAARILRHLKNYEAINEAELRKVVKKINEDLIKGIYCFYIKQSTINKIVNLNIWNKEKISQGERIVMNILEKYEIDYEYQYTNSFCKNVLPLPFDFYLWKYNVAIEYQGGQHYKPVYYYGKNKVGKEKAEQYFLKIQKHDKIKKDFCEESEIILLTPDYTMSYKEIEELILDTLGIETN